MWSWKKKVVHVFVLLLSEDVQREGRECGTHIGRISSMGSSWKTGRFVCVCVCSFPLTWKALLMLDPQALEEKHREIMKHVKSAWTATTVTLHQFPATSSVKHSKLERTSLNAGVYSSSVLVSEDMCVICLQLITLVWMFGSTIWKRCSVTKLSLSYMYEDQDDYMNVSQWTSHWNLTPVLKLINIISYLIN